MAKRYVVNLTSEERSTLEKLVNTGREAGAAEGLGDSGSQPCFRRPETAPKTSRMLLPLVAPTARPGSRRSPREGRDALYPAAAPLPPPTRPNAGAARPPEVRPPPRKLLSWSRRPVPAASVRSRLGWGEVATDAPFWCALHTGAGHGSPRRPRCGCTDRNAPASRGLPTPGGSAPSARASSNTRSSPASTSSPSSIPRTASLFCSGRAFGDQASRLEYSLRSACSIM